MGNPFMDRAEEPSPEYVRRSAQAQMNQQLSSPFLRAASIAQREEAARLAQTRFDARNTIEEQTLKLNQEKAAVQARIQKQALADKAAAIQQTGGFLNSVDKAAQKFGRGTKEFHAQVLADAKNYPSAINADPRIGSLLRFHEESYSRLGGTPEQATALWEVGQARAAAEKLPPAERLKYLESIPGKYPGAFKAGASETNLFKSLYDEAKKAAVPASVIPEGMEETSRTIRTPDGTVTVRKPEPAKPEKNTEKPDNFASFNKDLAEAVKAYGEKNVPPEIWAQFENRKKAITGGQTQKPASSAPIRMKLDADGNLVPVK